MSVCLISPGSHKKPEKLFVFNYHSEIVSNLKWRWNVTSTIDFDLFVVYNFGIPAMNLKSGQAEERKVCYWSFH